jgi:hypothetical protein
MSVDVLYQFSMHGKCQHGVWFLGWKQTVGVLSPQLQAAVRGAAVRIICGTGVKPTCTTWHSTSTVILLLWLSVL